MVEGNGGDGDEIVADAVLLQVLRRAIFQIAQMLILEQHDEGQFRSALAVRVVERDAGLAVLALPHVKEGRIVQQLINADGLCVLSTVALSGLVGGGEVAFRLLLAELPLLVLLEHVLLEGRTQVHRSIHPIRVNDLRKDHHEGEGEG